MELETLYEIKRTLEERRDNFFGDDTPCYGDQGYQDLLNDINDVEEDIERLETE